MTAGVGGPGRGWMRGMASERGPSLVSGSGEASLGEWRLTVRVTSLEKGTG